MSIGLQSYAGDPNPMFGQLEPDAEEYTGHVEPVSRLLQPLWYAGEREPWEMDLDEVLDVPEIALD